MKITRDAISCLLASAQSGSKDYWKDYHPVLEVVEQVWLGHDGKYPVVGLTVADGLGNEMLMKLDSTDPKLKGALLRKSGPYRQGKMKPGKLVCLVKFQTTMGKFMKSDAKESPMIVLEKVGFRVPKAKSPEKNEKKKKSPPKTKKLSYGEYIENCKCRIFSPCKCENVPESESESDSAIFTSPIPGEREAMNGSNTTSPSLPSDKSFISATTRQDLELVFDSDF